MKINIGSSNCLSKLLSVTNVALKNDCNLTYETYCFNLSKNGFIFLVRIYVNDAVTSRIGLSNLPT